MSEFIKITEDNIEKEHLCCIIREKKPHPGVEKKRAWLLNRLKDGHVFLKLNEKATVFIEYEPIETAWVPISGRRYLYIHCLWVLGEYKGKGYGTELMKYAIADAKAQGKAGLCMLGAKKHGFPISPLPKNSDSPKSIPRPTVINYSLCLSIKTQKNPRCPLSRRAHASAKSKIKSLRYLIRRNALTHTRRSKTQKKHVKNCIFRSL